MAYFTFRSVGRRVNLGFGSPRDSWLYYCSLQDFYVFWNGASTSTSGGVWLLLVTAPLLGVTGLRAHTNTHAHTTHSTQSPAIHGRSVELLLALASTFTSLSLHTECFIRHRPHRKHRVRQFFCCVCVFVDGGRCLRSRCQATIEGIHRHTESKVVS
jgi:hypothetical protein